MIFEQKSKKKFCPIQNATSESKGSLYCAKFVFDEAKSYKHLTLYFLYLSF